MPNELLLETGDNLLLEDDTGSYPYSFLLLETGYDPSPYLRTGTGKAISQVNDHGASAPGPFSWSGSTLGETGYNAVSGSANNGADTYAMKFDTGEILPSSGVITGIEIKVTAYSPAATLDLQTLAYGPYAAIYKNGTYQSSSGAGQYLTTSAAEYTIGGSSNALGVTWAAGDTIDIALWVNLYDAVGTTPNCRITDATMTIWYSDGSTYTVTLSEGLKAGDTFAPTRRLSFTITDGCVASDTLTAALRRAGAITDGAVATDTFVGLLRTTKTLTEGCTLADTFAATRRTTPTITDGCTLSDTHTATLRRTGTLADGAIVTDTLTGLLITTPTITDGAKLSDTLVGGLRFSKSISDGAKAGDTYTSLTGSLLTLSDGAKAGESLATVLRASGVVAEGCKAGESLAVVGVFGRTWSEGAVGGDVFAGSLDGNIVHVSVFYVLHGDETRPINLLGAESRAREVVGASNKFQELEG